MVLPSQFRINGPNVIHETVDNEVVIINLENGAYYGLEKCGADIWNLISMNTKVNDIVREMARRYNGSHEDLEGAIHQLLDNLVDEGLIVSNRMDGASSCEQPVPQPDEALSKQPFEPPQLRKYTDLQDFILLDPIHEAEESGWPDVPSTPKA